MAAIQIQNPTEAQRKLGEALRILDSISTFMVSQNLVFGDLFDSNIRGQLQSFVTTPGSLHPLLQDADAYLKIALPNDIQKLSTYCYKIQDSASQFDSVLDKLETQCKQMSVQNLASKGELINTLACNASIFNPIDTLLYIINTLILWYIRDTDAQTLADMEESSIQSKAMKSLAFKGMFDVWHKHNGNAREESLYQRIRMGLKWRQVCMGGVGVIATLCHMPYTLKLSSASIKQLVVTLPFMPEIVGHATRAQPCIEKFINLRLEQWRKLGAQSVPGTGQKRCQFGTTIPQLTKRRRVCEDREISQLPITTATIETVPDKALPAGWETHTAEETTRDTTADSVSAIEPPGGREMNESDEDSIASLAPFNFQPPNGPTPDGIATRVATGAEVEILGRILGDYLLDGASRSRTRQNETGLFTDAVRLHLPYSGGDDWKLEILVCSSVGQAFLQAKTGSVKDFSNKLGDFLWKHMVVRNRGNEEQNISTAIDVLGPNDDNSEDWRIGVMVAFGLGSELFKKMYPVFLN